MTSSTVSGFLTWMSQFAAMRDAVRGIWTRFLAAAPESQLTIEQCWLLMQLFNGPQTAEQLAPALALFVDQPSDLLAASEQRQLIERADAGYAIHPEARVKFQALLPVVQQYNQQWRAELFAGGTSTGDLELMLAMLQGRN